MLSKTRVGISDLYTVEKYWNHQFSESFRRMGPSGILKPTKRSDRTEGGRLAHTNAPAEAVLSAKLDYQEKKTRGLSIKYHKPTQAYMMQTEDSIVST